MSLPDALEALGFKEKPPKDARHRLLTEAMLELLREEAAKRASLQSYETLAQRTGMARGSIRVLMGQMIREAKTGKPRVRRGTDREQLDGMVNGREW